MHYKMKLGFTPDVYVSLFGCAVLCYNNVSQQDILQFHNIPPCISCVSLYEYIVTFQAATFFSYFHTKKHSPFLQLHLEVFFMLFLRRYLG